MAPRSLNPDGRYLGKLATRLFLAPFPSVKQETGGRKTRWRPAAPLKVWAELLTRRRRSAVTSGPGGAGANDRDPAADFYLFILTEGCQAKVAPAFASTTGRLIRVRRRDGWIPRTDPTAKEPRSKSASLISWRSGGDWEVREVANQEVMRRPSGIPGWAPGVCV